MVAIQRPGRVSWTHVGTWLVLALPLAVISTQEILAAYRMTIFDLLLAGAFLATLMDRSRSRSTRSSLWYPLVLAVVVLGARLLISESSIDSAAPELGSLLVAALTVYVILAPSRSRPNPRTFMSAWTVALAAAGFFAIVDRNAAAREIGFFRNPNELASFAFGSIVVLAAANQTGVIRKRRMYAGWIVAWALVIISGSRAGALSSLAFCLLYFARSATKNIREFVTAGLVIGVLLVVAAEGADNFAATIITEVGVSGERILTINEGGLPDFYADNWSQGLERFFESPFFGQGFTGSKVPSVVFAGDFEIHNSFLAVFAKFGLVGVALVIYGLRSGLRELIRPPWWFLTIAGISLVPLMAFHDLSSSRPMWLAASSVVLLWQENGTPWNQNRRRAKSSYPRGRP